MRTLQVGWGAMETSERPPEFVQSFERGLAVIRAFSRETPALTLSDMARRTGMTRAAARRFLITPEHLGYVASDGRMFTLRPGALQLGHAYLSSFSLAEIAQDHVGCLRSGCTSPARPRSWTATRSSTWRAPRRTGS